MDRVRFAIVGCGSVSKNRYFNHIADLMQGGGELAAVCDTVEERAQPRSEEFGVPYFTDLDKMLVEGTFELLAVLTPVQTHFSLALKGLEAGKHVYTQKPMTVSVEQASRLIDAAAQRNLKLVAEDARPIMRAFITIRKLLDDGVIGKPVWVRSTITHWGPAIIDNWPTDPSWFYQKGAGPLRDVGIEELHMLTSLLGPVRRVTAMSGINQPEVTVRGGPNRGKKITVTEDDVTLLVMDFGDNVFGMLDSAWVNTRAMHTPPLEIYGQKGVISLLSGAHPKAGPMEFDIRLYRDEPEHGIRGWTTVDVIPPLHPDPSPAVLGLVHAIECVKENKDPVLSGERARHCIEIIEKAFEAAKTGIAQILETSF